MDNYTSSISQREVDIFFGCISDHLKYISSKAKFAGFNLDSFIISLSGHSFKVGVLEVSPDYKSDKYFAISLPCEVNYEKKKKA